MITPIENLNIRIPIRGAETDRRYIFARMSAYYVPMSDTVEVHFRIGPNVGKVVRPADIRKLEDERTALYRAMMDVRDSLSAAISDIARTLISWDARFYTKYLEIDKYGRLRYTRRGFTGLEKII